MQKPYELGVAMRYLRSRNRNRFISFISLISVVGIALAVAVLIVVLSVMNGFEHEVREKILSVVSHAAITGWDGRLDDYVLAEDIIKAHPQTLAVARFVEGQGMLVGAAAVKGVEVRGIDPESERRASGIADMIEVGSLAALQPHEYRIILGRELAARLDASVGDRLILMIAQGVTTPAGLVPRMRSFTVSGIFHAGMYEYDSGLALINVDDAARLFRLGDAVSGVRISIADPLRAPAVVRDIAQSLGRDVYITDWTRQHANFFRSIQLTKSMIFIILLLVVAVAAFNIVSTLVMVVREKRAEIAILRTIGASPGAILRIFVAQGGLIGIVGTALGIAFGLIIAANIAWIVAVIEQFLGFRFLAPDVYFISDFPSQIRANDVILIGGIALLLAFVSTIYPAWRGAVLSPAEALRHD